MEFVKVLKARAEDNGGKIKVVDVSKKESEIEVKEIVTLSKIQYYKYLNINSFILSKKVSSNSNFVLSL